MTEGKKREREEEKSILSTAAEKREEEEDETEVKDSRGWRRHILFHGWHIPYNLTTGPKQLKLISMLK